MAKAKATVKEKDQDKIRVLFVCHGNICRSPMAEFLFKKLVADKGKADAFEIASAATSQEEIGSPIYPPAKALLKRLGIDTTGKTARQITRQDLDYYDFVIVMDSNNLRNLERLFGNYQEDKIHKCLDFSSRMGCDIADPWYTHNFEETYKDLQEGLGAFYQTLEENGFI